MTDYIFVFVMTFFLALSVWGMFHKPAPRPKKQYTGVKDLASWHKNVKTVWNG